MSGGVGERIGDSHAGHRRAGNPFYASFDRVQPCQVSQGAIVEESQEVVFSFDVPDVGLIIKAVPQTDAENPFLSVQRDECVGRSLITDKVVSGGGCAEHVAQKRTIVRKHVEQGRAARIRRQ